MRKSRLRHFPVLLKIAKQGSNSGFSSATDRKNDATLTYAYQGFTWIKNSYFALTALMTVSLDNIAITFWF